MANIELKEENGWINIGDYDKVDNTGIKPVDDILQDIICAAPEDATIYFPRGKYLFEKGVEINKRLTLRGDAYTLSNTPQNEFLYAGVTHFAVMKKDNITVLRVKGVTHCIQNICFSSDSYSMKTTTLPPTDGKPHLHHVPTVVYENVSAIQCMNSKTGVGYYENLFISGFSGTALEMPDHSMANDITVFSCKTGISTGENTTISNSKVWGAGIGMVISTGTLINNMRVEEISYIAIKNIGKGSNFITNITVDQCGYCGFLFDEIKYVYISGSVTRCGQYYFSLSYEDYLKLDEKEKIEMANSYFYGNKMSACNITLCDGNVDNWEDEGKLKHEAYVVGANETKNVFLTCNVDASGLITLAKGYLTLYNGRITSRFQDSNVCSVAGVGIGEENDGGIIKILEGVPYINQDGNYLKTYEPKLNDVVYSSIHSISSFNGQYEGTWEKIVDQYPINSVQRVSCYKKVSDLSK